MPSPDSPPPLPETAPPRPRRHRPLVPIALGLSLGIILAEGSAEHVVRGFVLGAVLAALCTAVALRWDARRGLLLSAAGALLFGYSYTLWMAVYLPPDHISRHLPSMPVTLEGRVLRVVEGRGDRTTLDLKARALGDGAATQGVSGRVRVTAYGFQPEVRAGDTIQVQRLRLRRPSGFRNPGAFDYGRYLARRGIHATGSISRADRIEVVQRPPAGVFTRLSGLKAELTGQLARALGEPSATIAQAMVFGGTAALPREVREAFSVAGTAHLMSVSGLHVGFVYAAIFVVLKHLFLNVRFRLLGRFSGGPRPSKLAAACGLVGVIGYACLVGPNFPTVRATLMLATYVIAYLIDRDGDPFQTTALAALLILALHPLGLFEIGFQLSFAGVLAILYANRLLHPPAGADPGEADARPLSAQLTRKLREAALIALFASLGTAPLILYYFHRASLIAPLANLVVVPLASLVVPLGLLAPLAALLARPLGDVLLPLTGMGVTLLHTLVHLFAQIPYAAPRIGPVALPLIALLYGVLLGAPHVRAARWARWSVVGAAIIVGLGLAVPWLLPHGRGQLRVTFLDVGQGEAAFIRFPQGMTMLIDGGGSFREDFDVGERVVAPFLWHQRVRRIDYAVASHPHPDHARGLTFILQEFGVRHFWDNGTPLRSSWYRALREAAVQRGIYADPVATGFTSAHIEGVRVELLHPTPDFQPRPDRRRRAEDRMENDRSLVLKLSYGQTSFLFPGDIERDAEAFLLQRGLDVRATVLKVPHHGSLTSSTGAFLQAVRPLAVVFSVQRDNRFGHPHRAVVDRYAAAGAHVFRTDRDGAITFRTDGQRLWVESYAHPAPAIVIARPSAVPPPQSAP